MGNIILRLYRKKCNFVVLVEKCVLRIWQKNVCLWKLLFVVLEGKCVVSVLAENVFLQFWWENVFYGFGGKINFGQIIDFLWS